MVIDFSKLNLKETPKLILKTAGGSTLAPLSSALNVTVDIKYNEPSTLEFTLPAYFGGIKNAGYDDIQGMRIVDLQGIGQFVLENPKEESDGIKLSKTCKAYSLEYEFTRKKITLESGTYNFWNPVSKDDTIIGIILEIMPSWSVGSISPTLLGKYRTFEVNGENLYDFIKGALQDSCQCIFDFDTYSRTINVRDVNDTVVEAPVLISQDNLAKKIIVEEQSDKIFTAIDVYGADGIDIRDVNPTGTNQIINLDYFMTPDNFSQQTMDNYHKWKTDYKYNQVPYFNLSIEYSMLIMRKAAEEAALRDLSGELTGLENVQASVIQAIAKGLMEDTSEYNFPLTEATANVAAKKDEIKRKESLVSEMAASAGDILNQMKAINQSLSWDNYFSGDELIILDKYIKEDSISESSFASYSSNEFVGTDLSLALKPGAFQINNSSIETINASDDKTLYIISGGSISVGNTLKGNIISATLDKKSDGSFLFTARMSGGTVTLTDGTLKGFVSGQVLISGNISNGSFGNSYISFNTDSGNLYFTNNASEYEKRSVAWDLFEYGTSVLQNISRPSYSFSVDCANFLSADEFAAFKNKIGLGLKCYVKIDDNTILKPIVIGAKISYDSPDSLTFTFGDKYASPDSAFEIADLLEKSVSMGKTVDLKKYTYASFVDGGAKTEVREFITSAIDVATNAILSSKNQAISWDDTGLRIRKWNSDKTDYEPKQVWVTGNSLMMTSNNWSSAEIAIGEFKDANLGNMWGIVAPNIVGTLLAGETLIVQGKKAVADAYGDRFEFRLDGNGCYLFNSDFNVISGNTQIMLNPKYGIVMGQMPLFKTNEDGVQSVNKDNATFWVDINGNLHFKGTLEGADGHFTGKITASEGSIGGWEITENSLSSSHDSGSFYISSASSSSQNWIEAFDGADGAGSSTFSVSKTGVLKATGAQISGLISADSGKIGGWDVGQNNISSTKGSNYFYISSSADTTSGCWISAESGGDVTFSVSKTGVLYASGADISGNITATSGTIGGCSIVNGVLSIDAANITSGIFDSAVIGSLTVTNSMIAPGTIVAAEKIKTDSYNITGGNVSIPYGNSEDGYYQTLGSSGMSVGNTSSNYTSIRETGVMLISNNTNFTYSRQDINGFRSFPSPSNSPVGSMSFGISTSGTQPSTEGAFTCGLFASIEPSGDQSALVLVNGQSFISGVYGNLSTYNFRIGRSPEDNLNLIGNVTINGSPATASDRNLKNTIEKTDGIYSEFFDRLIPSTFKYNDSKTDETHVGFVAQQVEDALIDSGMSPENSGLVTIQNGTRYLRYEEFIAINTREIQQLKQRVKHLEYLLSKGDQNEHSKNK